MEGLPTRSSEISPFFSSKQNSESQASNNSGGPGEGKILMVSSVGLFCGAEERTLGLEKTHQSLDMDNEESVRFFPKPRGPRWGSGRVKGWVGLLSGHGPSVISGGLQSSLSRACVVCSSLHLATEASASPLCNGCSQVTSDAMLPDPTATSLSLIM